MVDKQKWTRGPWHLLRNRVGNGWLLYDSAEDQPDYIALLKDRMDSARFEESYANALLISKAPELYEALAEMVLIWRENPQRSAIAVMDAVERAEAVLKAVRGE